jgi:hypothetical protein
VAAIPILHAFGALSFAVLVLLAFGIGLFVAPHLASQRALLPELLGMRHTTVMRSNAALQACGRCSATQRSSGWPTASRSTSSGCGGRPGACLWVALDVPPAVAAAALLASGPANPVVTAPFTTLATVGVR